MTTAQLVAPRLTCQPEFAKHGAVPSVSFTSHLSRHVECPAEQVRGATVREALDDYFERHPKVRTYVLDEQRMLRHHVVVFVGGTQARDRRNLSDPVGEGDEIHVLQALSGG
jgi:molybdopterin converting factor small subunit